MPLILEKLSFTMVTLSNSASRSPRTAIASGSLSIAIRRFAALAISLECPPPPAVPSANYLFGIDFKRCDGLIKQHAFMVKFHIHQEYLLRPDTQ
jgi:hypothetical protein